jgi:CRISPR-associated endonuclease/helicase Cas3
MLTFDDFFVKATGYEPFPWQRKMGSANKLPGMISIPTGMGKTAGVVIPWLWRRLNSIESTPLRLAYCLPMRVLVEQTETQIRSWIHNLGMEVDCHILLGGYVNKKWDRYPERAAVIVGTQDMLLSRALNRGYAESRFRWPVQFALLNNDCLWVLDEVQLMGAGLPTTLQMHAFRDSFGHHGVTDSIWMSATISRDWLETVDHNCKDIDMLEMSNEDMNSPVLKKRYEASKIVEEVPADSVLEEKIINAHQPGTLTLVVRNTVASAIETYKGLKKVNTESELLLLHSRYRKQERDSIVSKLFSPLPEAGRILVSTQIVEAGVDISGFNLFTDVAPWASLVQRFGRCNRKGEYSESRVYWIRPEEKKGFGLPYKDEEVAEAVSMLEKMNDVCSVNLQFKLKKPDQHSVIRRRDIVDLFDTTPDLAGSDIDISRFIRNTDGRTAFAFWRRIVETDIESQQQPCGEELCRIPVYELDKLLKNSQGWIWDHLENKWAKAGKCRSGVPVMLDLSAGCYTPEMGWALSQKQQVEPVLCKSISNEANDDDPDSVNESVTIACHTESVVGVLRDLCTQLNISSHEHLETAARWHDAGKVHWAFQGRFGNESSGIQAKGKWTIPRRAFPRTGFRHELASAIALLENGGSDLSAYLVAAHHGKVRLSIRSLPIEKPPETGVRYARGIYDGDVLERTELGSGVVMPETKLKLDLMELGGGGNHASWLERTLKLRDIYGPFLLAYFEAVLRIADWRASEGEVNNG